MTKLAAPIDVELTGEIDIRSLFPTPLVIAEIKDAAGLNEVLSALILARAASHPSVSKSNLGGWQSADDFEQWGGDAGTALVEAIRGIVDKITCRFADGALSPANIPWRVNGWANLNRAGDINELHTHAGSYWSCAYYVDAGNEGGDAEVGGEFEVADPRGVAPTLYAPTIKMGIRNCLTAGLSEFIKPQSGQVFVFPAWLSHGVRPYKGTRPRVSLAFNFCL